MNYRYDVQLMVKAAEMYYTDRLTQEEIARQLKVSRSSVSLILSEALEKGIIEITVKDPQLSNESIAEKYKTLFPVRECHIISTSIKDPDAVIGIVAERTVAVYNKIIENGETVGLAWGRTCYEFVARYKASKVLNETRIVPLIGGSDQSAKYFQLNEMVRQFAEKLSGTPFFIHAPAVTASKEDRNMFMTSSVMQPILEKWKNMDVIITGIGAPPGNHQTSDENKRYWPGKRPLGEETIAGNLQKENAVGDICAQYFDINGRFIGGLSENIIGISDDNLRNTRTVIGVAVGPEKALSVVGALRTGVIDVFVCDEPTALRVLAVMEH